MYGNLWHRLQSFAIGVKIGLPLNKRFSDRRTFVRQTPSKTFFTGFHSTICSANCKNDTYKLPSSGCWRNTYLNIMNVSSSPPFLKVPYRGDEAAKKAQQSYVIGHFSVESVLVLFWLTASLLVLPLILPPLPPPPFILLLVPIAIFVVLMGLALMPFNVPNISAVSSV